jgi:hypothetical protein
MALTKAAAAVDIKAAISRRVVDMYRRMAR